MNKIPKQELLPTGIGIGMVACAILFLLPNVLGFLLTILILCGAFEINHISTKEDDDDANPPPNDWPFRPA